MSRAVQRNKHKSLTQAALEALNVATVANQVTQSQIARQRFLQSNAGLSNPAFLLTSGSNRLIDNGTSIRRGYIRRSDIDPADPTSNYRLYFMYNPATIQREYVAYLDQLALDPGNALFGSANMAAAPGIIDFSFELLFDRALEVAQDNDHPGTKVDYDYFDLVVRGVVPGGTGEGNEIPDNGIMMVNPNNITVVFGQDLTVHGRPYNAAVSFDKFNHRMTPTRMAVSIVMKAFYIGPIRTNYNFSTTATENVAAATVPYSSSRIQNASATTVDSAFFDNVQLTDSSVSAYRASSLRPAGSAPVAGDRSGRVLTIRQTAQYAAAAGFSGEALTTVVAIAKAESGLRTDARGDTGITDATWGPSIGLMQIRSLNNQRGTGGPRDEEANLDPAHNMWAAWIVSSQGTNFNPWSVYTSGSYRRFMDEVRQELGVFV